MRSIKIIFILFIFCLLTTLTQIGGIVYLISFLTYAFIHKQTKNKIYRTLLKTTVFVCIYAAATFFIVPMVAPIFGRVPLPLTETNHLKPLTSITYLFNRHYVRPELKQAALNAANEMQIKFPGTTVNYLDGNFPFINKFPLLLHLSHNDGRKLDLAFCYLDTKTGKPTSESPSIIGYGVCEEALPFEKNTADFCAEKGYWHYSFLTNVVPQNNKKNFQLDNARTRELVICLTDQPTIGKLFIEPHLISRLNLHSEKIRFHGCQAVRHDDHIHINYFKKFKKK